MGNTVKFGMQLAKNQFSYRRYFVEILRNVKGSVLDPSIKGAIMGSKMLIDGY